MALASSGFPAVHKAGLTTSLNAFSHSQNAFSLALGLNVLLGLVHAFESCLRRVSLGL